MRKKIDKTLREVRRWKRKISAKTRKMSAEKAVSFFRDAQAEMAHLTRKPRAA